MEIDPEVAALLEGGLPPVKLPPALIKEGWGQRSMRTAAGGRLVSPSTETQPIYDHRCVQCGRPITMGRREMWIDHAGNRTCENVLLDEQVAPYHVVDHELKYWELIKPQPRKFRDLIQKAGPCNATNSFGPHPHICLHPKGHFGFHECEACHHLWK